MSGPLEPFIYFLFKLMADFYRHCEKLHLQTKLTKSSAFFRGHDLMVDHTVLIIILAKWKVKVI